MLIQDVDLSVLQEDEIDVNPLEEKDNAEAELYVETEIQPKLKLDYTLTTAKERNEFVKKIIANSSEEQLTPRYLEILSNYIVFAMDKEEKKQKEILTDNRLITINKRETSFEGIASKLESGEDGIYNLQSDLGKSAFLTVKDPITEEDIANIPALRDLREEIQRMEEIYKKATGKRKYQLKKQIIEMRQDQYVIRNAHRGGYGGRPRIRTSSFADAFSKINFEDKYRIDEKGNPVNDGLISFFNPKHIEMLLCNYSALKQAAYGHFENDLWYMMDDLDELVNRALEKDYPLYYDLLIYKIDGRTNLEIQSLLEKKYGIHHTVEYLSSLWRKKIPRLIASKAEEDYLLWYYTFQEYGKWKKCNRCGKVKLAHNKFFSKNGSSKDGWYSLCKDCRNAKSQKNQKLIQMRIKNQKEKEE